MALSHYLWRKRRRGVILARARANAAAQRPLTRHEVIVVTCPSLAALPVPPSSAQFQSNRMLGDFPPAYSATPDPTEMVCVCVCVCGCILCVSLS